MSQSEFYQELVESLIRPLLEPDDITVKQLAIDSDIGEGKARRQLEELTREGELEKHEVWTGRAWAFAYRVPKKAAKK